MLCAHAMVDAIKQHPTIDPPRLKITGRTAYMLSAFGEHLIDEEIEAAVAAAARAIDADVSDHAVGALHPTRSSDRGRHVFVVEFAAPPNRAALARFATAIDDTLGAANDDYRAHRAGGFGMGAPEIRDVSPGTFAGWMKSRGQLGGQHKVPRVISDGALLENLLGFVAAPRPYDSPPGQ